MTHVLAFGELLLRLSPPGDERLLQSSQFQVSAGGCEANVAVGLAQYGVPVEYLTRLPNNAIADAALRTLQAEGVGTRHVMRGGERMGLYYLERGAELRALRSVYDRAHSAFTGITPEQTPFDAALAGASWIHTSGIVAALGDSALATLQVALQKARGAGVRTSFDCNFRPALWQGRNPQSLIVPLMSQVDLLIGNPGAFHEMLGETTAGTMPEPPESLRDTAERLHRRFGIERIAITQRDVRDASTHAWRAWLWQAGDSTLHDGGQFVVRVVDRVGGGDAFASGLLASLHRNSAPADAIRFATAAGAHKLTVPGDFPRTSWNEVEALALKNR